MTVETESVLLSELAKTVKADCLLRRSPNTTDRKADWKETCFHWSVSLSYGGRTMRVDYYMGAAHVTKERRPFKNAYVIPGKPIPPDSGSVLSSLLLDASACEQTFDDWCADLGYNSDSRKDLALYLECQESGKRLRTLLGADYSKFASAENDI